MELFYVTLLGSLMTVAVILHLRNTAFGGSEGSVPQPPGFAAFRANYLLVYSLMMGRWVADGMGQETGWLGSGWGSRAARGGARHHMVVRWHTWYKRGGHWVSRGGRGEVADQPRDTNLSSSSPFNRPLWMIKIVA